MYARYYVAVSLTETARARVKDFRSPRIFHSLDPGQYILPDLFNAFKIQVTTARNLLVPGPDKFPGKLGQFRA
jgi:hypothetical protein